MQLASLTRTVNIKDGVLTKGGQGGSLAAGSLWWWLKLRPSSVSVVLMRTCRLEGFKSTNIGTRILDIKKHLDLVAVGLSSSQWHAR